MIHLAKSVNTIRMYTDCMSELDPYDYELPRQRIAQEPVRCRSDARLLVVDRQQGTWHHHHIRDLPEILAAGDRLVLNDTRVVPAQLAGRRTATGGRWQGLYLEEQHRVWRILSKTRGKLREGETITLLDREGREGLQLQMLRRDGAGGWWAVPNSDDATLELLERVGRVPLPPYIRGGKMVPSDRKTYQTVFAKHPGAVAAPTAGLHFTEALLATLQQRDVGLSWITLHVGSGTFRPIVTQTLGEHQMHSEWACLGEQTARQLNACRAAGGRVVAVGTTSVRTLEAAARTGKIEPFTGETDLFIRPPHEFRAVDVLLTNFHLPRTSLLVLVAAFTGLELMRQAYAEAIRQEYRFYSYGDAMLVV